MSAVSSAAAAAASTATTSTPDQQNQLLQQQASTAMSDIITSQSGGYVAHVTFRVRCESLGYGEELFLVVVPTTTTSEISKTITDPTSYSAKVTLHVFDSKTIDLPTL